MNTSEQTAQSAQIEPSEEVVVDEKKRKRQFLMYNAKQVLLVFVAALATAVSLEVFLLPGNVIVGGALGIASIMDILLCSGPEQWYLSAGIWLFVVNVPILIYCFVSYRRRFAVKTLLYVVFLAIQLVLLRVLNVASVFGDIFNGNGAKDPVIYVILGGALHGVSLPIMLSVNASTGGSDIVGLIAQKRSKKSSSVAMRTIMLANAVIVLISSIVYFVVNESASAAVDMFVYSIAAIFICEIVQEGIFKGFSAALEIEITTDKPEEMSAAIQRELKHGVSTVKVMGGHSHQEKSLIICVVNKRQLTHARKVINSVDDKAFAYVENVKEVMGKGFANKEIELDEE